MALQLLCIPFDLLLQANNDKGMLSIAHNVLLIHAYGFLCVL